MFVSFSHCLCYIAGARILVVKSISFVSLFYTDYFQVIFVRKAEYAKLIEYHSTSSHLRVKIFPYLPYYWERIL